MHKVAEKSFAYFGCLTKLVFMRVFSFFLPQGCLAPAARVLGLCILVGLLAGCKARRANQLEPLGVAVDKVLKSTDPGQQVPIWAAAAREPRQYTRVRRMDLLHTELSVRFDWAERSLRGRALLQLTPYFYPTDSLVLDAKGLDIHSLQLAGGTPLTYRYADSLQLHIALPHTYTRRDTLWLEIDYTARPYRLQRAGSEYISGAQGLYFINADGQHPYKPRQIWTQGETEASSCWFPTIDQPNERCTQDLRITADSSYQTLSNGLLMSSTPAPSGQRTDRWVLTQPHAPYLFMMAVGKFYKHTDTWRGREVSYYVEPAYAPYAQLVFGHTPEMLEFFSQKLGVPYPWPKYSQVVVRDFVSGAMENTTATIHYSELQHDSLAHLDESREDFISHELAHQWFGDLVTCESWGQLPLNESFATYGEYLWREHKYGKDNADAHLAAEKQTYLSEATTKRRPLIREAYADAGDLFDAHSYQKGGLVLHYLRQQLGDEAFFAGIQRYLQQHAYQPVEVHDLRLALEAVSGRDLTPFFQQWFYAAGHPALAVTYEYDLQAEALRVHVLQQQDLRYQPVYTLPLQLEIAGHRGTQRVAVTIHSADTVLTIPYPSAPPTAIEQGWPAFIQNVELDADHVLPGTISETKPPRFWVYQLGQGRGFGQRMAALEQLPGLALPAAEIEEELWRATQDPIWQIRVEALQYLAQLATSTKRPDRLDSLLGYYLGEPQPAVRSAAIELLANYAGSEGGGRASQAYQKVLTALEAALHDSSYSVRAHALVRLGMLEPARAVQAALPLQHAPDALLSQAVIDILLENKHPAANALVVEKLWRLESYMRILIMNSYSAFLQDRSPEEMRALLPVLMYTAEMDSQAFVQDVAGSLLAEMEPHLPELKPWLERSYPKRLRE